MFKRKTPRQEALFIPGRLSDFIPDDHILKRVDKVLDLSWLDDEVSCLYSENTGRPCIEPERALRLMLCGFFHGIVKDRKLMREAQVNIAIRWFCGYELDEALPDHSSLSRIRQRWGVERFSKVLKKTILQCAKAGLVGGETLHCDASLIRADVSWESLVKVHVEKVTSENPETEDAQLIRAPEPSGRMKKVSTTDPEASMATSSRKVRLEPTYKQHTAVDDRAGVIVDVEVTTGEVNEGKELLSQLRRVEETVGRMPEIVTADKGYGSGSNYQALEALGITAVIPPQKERHPKGNMPLSRFRYDEKHDVVRCPGKKTLTRRNRNEHGYFYRAKPSDCRSCRLRDGCIPKSCHSRSVLLVDGYLALLRARRKKRQGWDEVAIEAYNRHRYQVEGVHGESKAEHGLARAARRGLPNARIQSYLTATVINLKRLAKALAEAGLDPCAVLYRLSCRLLSATEDLLALIRSQGLIQSEVLSS